MSYFLVPSEGKTCMHCEVMLLRFPHRGRRGEVDRGSDALMFQVMPMSHFTPKNPGSLSKGNYIGFSAKATTEYNFLY